MVRAYVDPAYIIARNSLIPRADKRAKEHADTFHPAPHTLQSRIAWQRLYTRAFHCAMDEMAREAGLCS